ncbi:MAG: type II toxin-antitoxin system death-on-curing family toxin [Sulfuriferula sp.]|nr:type II toxin-antitoxin system death-on-curing family toxin [Sulfuriferula sp.]
MPLFITLEVALAIHHDQIEIFGGMHGIREQNLLESALGQSAQTFAYTADIYQAAAALGVSMARNHPFVDGNKRSAADCMLTFLVMNGLMPTLTNVQLFEWMLCVAIGDLERDALAALLHQHTQPDRA